MERNTPDSASKRRERNPIFSLKRRERNS